MQQKLYKQAKSRLEPLNIQGFDIGFETIKGLRHLKVTAGSTFIVSIGLANILQILQTANIWDFCSSKEILDLALIFVVENSSHAGIMQAITWAPQ